MRRYEQRIRSCCINTLCNSSLAEDAAQEIFIKAYQALNKFNFNSSFSTWLYRIAFNHCQDILRKQSNQKNESWEELIEKEGDKIEALISSSESDSLSTENLDLARRLLNQVSERYRNILVLREVQGLTYSEIAETLNCSIDSVKAKLRRARKELFEIVRHVKQTSNV